MSEWKEVISGDYILSIFYQGNGQENILTVLKVFALLSPFILGFCSVFYFVVRGRAALGAFGLGAGFSLMAHLWIPAFICLIPFLFLNVKIWKDWYSQLWEFKYIWVILLAIAVIGGISIYFWFGRNILAAILSGFYIALAINFLIPYTLFYCVLFPLSKLCGRNKTVIATVNRKEEEHLRNDLTPPVGFNLEFKEFAGEFCVPRKLFESLKVGDCLKLEMVSGLCGIKYCIKYERLGQQE